MGASSPCAEAAHLQLLLPIASHRRGAQRVQPAAIEDNKGGKGGLQREQFRRDLGGTYVMHGTYDQYMTHMTYVTCGPYVAYVMVGT